MKIRAGLLCLCVVLSAIACGRRVITASIPVMAAPIAVSQPASPGMLNPLRFSADEIRPDGNMWRLHGHVVVKFASSVIVYAEDADYGSCSLCPAPPVAVPPAEPRHALTTHDEARLAMPSLRALPDRPFPLTDLRRFQADQIRDEGGILHLHGNVVIHMPGVRIGAGDAAFDSATATITTRGDAGIILLKALVTPSDNLGPEAVVSSGAQR